jgi:hypothetical protein
VEVTLRTSPGGRTPTIPLETGIENKEMGRVLLRRGGETIAAGGSCLGAVPRKGCAYPRHLGVVMELLA